MLFSTSTFDSSKLDNPSYALCWLSRNYHRSCLEHHTFIPCVINNSTNRICFPLPNYLGNNLFIRRREVNVQSIEESNLAPSWPRTECVQSNKAAVWALTSIRDTQRGCREELPLSHVFFSSRSFSCPYPRSITFSNHISVEVSYLR